MIGENGNHEGSKTRKEVGERDDDRRKWEPRRLEGTKGSGGTDWVFRDGKGDQDLPRALAGAPPPNYLSP